MTEAPIVSIVELTNSTGFPRRYTCADGTAISKGIILTNSDPRTVTKAGANVMITGVAAMDKEASDGSTSITAYTDLIFEARASGAITAGYAVFAAGLNEVKQVTEALIASGAIYSTAYALETATDQEVINVRLRS